jgi:hypothetical protein
MVGLTNCDAFVKERGGMNETKFDITEGALERWEAHGLDCMIRSSGMLALNGYVRVPKEHPVFGKGYNSVDVDVHGGITYADEAGWFGFDTLHAGDWWATGEGDESTRLDGARLNRPSEEAPWTRLRLRREVERLAEQLKEMS